MQLSYGSTCEVNGKWEIVNGKGKERERFCWERRHLVCNERESASLAFAALPLSVRKS
jgi:hypothetical protein